MPASPIEDSLQEEARGAGLAHVHTIEDDKDFEACLPFHFKGPGSRIFIWKVHRADEPVPKPRAYIRERALQLRQALSREQKIP